MDWDKKIYLSDVLDFFTKPFVKIADKIKWCFDQVFEIKWKGAHEAWVRKDSSYTTIVNSVKRRMTARKQDTFDDGMRLLDRQMKDLEDEMRKLDDLFK